MNETVRDPLNDALTTVTGPEADERPAGQSGHPALSADEIARMTDDIVNAIKTVYDPEIPADIYELGLIYKIEIGEDRKIDVEMTLTSPAGNTASSISCNCAR